MRTQEESNNDAYLMRKQLALNSEALYNEMNVHNDMEKAEEKEMVQKSAQKGGGIFAGFSSLFGASSSAPKTSQAYDGSSKRAKQNDKLSVACHQNSRISSYKMAPPVPKQFKKE